MAGSKYTIDVEGRFIDNVSGKAKGAADSVEGIGDAAEKASKKVKGLGKQKAKPIFDADNNKFLKKVREAEEKAKKLVKTKTALILTAIDKASTIIGKVLNKAKSFGGSTWTGFLKVTDKATSIIKGVVSAGKGIAGKTWQAMVKIKDMATSPLKKIKDSLFSIKTLVMAITAGFATKQLVLNPINIADAYSSAKIGFSTLLGESAGQKMMDDLDAFAKATPFNTTNVISNAQKMMAMGWSTDTLIEDMETIGNAAAATGKLDTGLESIVRAMSQIKTKGKLSAEELNQLAEAGINAKAILAEELGYGTGDAGLAAFSKDQENGAIGADKALSALLKGLKKYDGMMESMANETVEGLWSQIKDTFQINILRKWGQGLQDGAKKGFGTILDLLDSSEDALSDLGDTLHDIGKTASNWLADRLSTAVKRIKDITGSVEFKEASLGGKVKMLWDGVIANPFSEWWTNTVVPWWDNTVMPWLADKAAGIGKGIGAGLTAGITTLLGLDVSGAVEDGATIGGAFMEGFLEGFDTEKIGEALSNWASENKGLATSIGVVLGAKLLGSLGGWIGNIKTLFGGKGGTGGTGGLGSTSVATMNVQAGVVNLGTYSGDSTPALPPATTGGGSTPVPTGTGGKTSLWSKIGTGLAGFAGKLGFTGSSAAGATAVGGASVASIIAGLLGVGDAGVDVWQGAKAQKAGNSKEAKDKYVTAGTKAGIMATGAGAGAGIGALIGSLGGPIGTGLGALFGFGIGGIASIFGGDKLGKKISDSTDEGGGLNKAWKATKKFFGETIPEKWNQFCDGTAEFFTESIPDAWDSMKEKVSSFFTETIPEKWNEFLDGVETFFTETVPYGIGYAAGKIHQFFTETIPEKWNAFWDAVGNFFTETIPEWAESVWSGYIVPFFTESIPNFFGTLWDGIKEFFTESLPQWGENVWNNYIVPFFTESVPQFFGNLWDIIKEFFTESLPQWGENVWNNHIVPFFTESVPNWFSNLWDSVCSFFTETLPSIASAVWTPISTFFTETVPGWVSSIWDKVSGWFGDIKDNFLAGFEGGSGGGGGKKARGGIVGGSSSMEAFAAGGMVRGGSRFVKVAEEGTPEMIIPLGSHRRDRGLKLWAKAGQMMGVPGFARGGRTDGRDEGFNFRWHGSDESSGGGQLVQIEVGGITVEFHISVQDGDNIVDVIKTKAKEIAETIAGEIADALEGQFENTPVKGGAA